MDLSPMDVQFSKDYGMNQMVTEIRHGKKKSSTSLYFQDSTVVY
jgi:hypothetical protein